MIKWVGGKQQIIKEIMEHIPREIDTYYELFLGGGSVLIELLEQMNAGTIHVRQIVANDINSGLINMYIQVKENPDTLMVELDVLSETLRRLPEIRTEPRARCEPPTTVEEVKHRKEYYYFIRSKFNEMASKEMGNEDVLHACYFIFLNKVGFRGLYRESNGKFNVPYGHYANPVLYKKETIERLSYLFNIYNVQFTNRPFTDYVTSFKRTDFVYLDPPYYPINTSSFTDIRQLDFAKRTIFR
jgi:DNA adenine methylase